MGDETIFLTSNEPWGNLWFSKQHYAFELAKLGCQVYFINPTKKWSISNLFSVGVLQSQVNEKLVVLTYRNNFPQGKKFRFFVPLNDVINCYKIKRQIKVGSKDVIWWKFDPYRFLNISFFKKSKQIYHVVDPHLHLWQDKRQAQRANLIVCSSPKYIEYYKKKGGQHVLQVPHGISEDEFLLDEEQLGLVKTEYGDFVVVIGTIAQDVDLELIKRIALEQINVLIIGREVLDTEEWRLLKEMSNVHYIGLLHAKRLKNYVAAAKAGLIVYNFTPYHKEQLSRSPLKALNYLAQYIPVISSINTEIKVLENKGVYQAVDYEGYIQLVKDAVENKLEVNAPKIKEYLHVHQYPKLIHSILNHLSKC